METKWQDLHQCLNLGINDNRLRLHQAEGLHTRIQTQLGVLHSLISQRDSKVNIELAKDSRKIAAAAQRDSKVMRIIAILTLVFLPATLTSVRLSSLATTVRRLSCKMTC